MRRSDRAAQASGPPALAPRLEIIGEQRVVLQPEHGEAPARGDIGDDHHAGDADDVAPPRRCECVRDIGAERRTEDHLRVEKADFQLIKAQRLCRPLCGKTALRFEAT